MADGQVAPFPRAPLVGAALLLGTVLLAVALVRVTDIGSATTVDAPAAMTRLLRFADRPDGAIEITDASRAAPPTVLSGTHGFMRGVLRGLARERKRQGIGPEVPFELVAHEDGRLTLVDPATGRRVDLESFGPINLEEFAQLLDMRAAP